MMFLTDDVIMRTDGLFLLNFESFHRAEFSEFRLTFFTPSLTLAGIWLP